MKLCALLLIASTAFAWPHITARGITEAAGVTTIVINVLDIKGNVQKARHATGVVKKTTVVAVKKVAKTVAKKARGK